jgi:hypothetical protein
MPGEELWYHLHTEWRGTLLYHLKGLVAVEDQAHRLC